MKSAILSVALTGAILACSALASSAETRLRLELSGVFDTEGFFGGHPDIAIGDKFFFFMEFDDTHATGAGGPQLNLYSSSGAGLLVNDAPHAGNAPTSFGGQADNIYFPSLPPGPNIKGLRGFDLNDIGFVVQADTKVPSPVGAGFDFPDFLFFNSMRLTEPSWLIVYSGDPSNSITGTITDVSVAVVPEPGGMALTGLAGLGLLLRRRR